MSAATSGRDDASEPEPEGASSEPVPPARKRRKKRLPKIISPTEARLLLEAADDDTDVGIRDRCMLELMYRAGLRVSEVVGLAPRDVEDDGIVRLYDAKGGDGTAYFTPDRVLPHLERWRAVRPSWARTDSFLFCHRDGTSISTRYVQRLMVKLKREVGIVGKCTPHVLRHTFATEMLEEGFTLSEVQSALRHVNLQTTAVYLHVRDESLRRKMTNRGALPDDERR